MAYPGLYSGKQSWLLRLFIFPMRFTTSHTTRLQTKFMLSFFLICLPQDHNFQQQSQLTIPGSLTSPSLSEIPGPFLILLWIMVLWPFGQPSVPKDSATLQEIHYELPGKDISRSPSHLSTKRIHATSYPPWCFCLCPRRIRLHSQQNEQRSDANFRTRRDIHGESRM
jgi:hypothetical protein